MAPLIRYQSMAFLLKVVSATPHTRHFYRWLGNRTGATRRQQIGPHFMQYIECAPWMVAQLDKLVPSMSAPVEALEIGTGWIHFYAVLLRLFYSLKVTLFDVWDCRQFEALGWIFSRMPDYLDDAMALPPERSARMRSLAAEIAAQPTIDDVYRLLGFDYVVDPNGELGAFHDAQFDLVFSSDVLEHVHAVKLEDSVRAYTRVLRPGGYMIHQIGLDDHLSHYDAHALKRQYLAYSDFMWRLRFENKLQYFNRLPNSAFRELFLACGLEELCVSPICEEGTEPRHIARPFREWSREDRQATRGRFLYRKPFAAAPSAAPSAA